MGMFDRLYDNDGIEWQTKAFDCLLHSFKIGDRIVTDTPATYQVEVMGGPGQGLTESLATVEKGVLVSVNDARDHAVPLVDYFGGVVQS